MPPGNVLLITGDQWRGDALGHFGHPVARTPQLDRLARGGASFARHYGVTSPCGPARASLHTGLHAHHHRSVINGTPLDSRIPTMATRAREAGYAPTMFGYTDTTADPTGLAADDPRLFTYEGVLPGYEVGLLLPEHHRPWLDHVRRVLPQLADEFQAANRPVDGIVAGSNAASASAGAAQGGCGRRNETWQNQPGRCASSQASAASARNASGVSAAG